MWRQAREQDDDAIVAMTAALQAEDPAPQPVPLEHMRRTLAVLRREPLRGCAVVFDDGAGAVAYALLTAVWSNELGGEVRVIDELYVAPVSPDNTRARALYARLGFAPVRNTVMRAKAHGGNA
jgi:hypothetical protein